MPQDNETQETFITVGICADDQHSQFFSMVSLLVYAEFINYDEFISL